MMWDFGNRDQEAKARNRSKSPHPPHMRAPSPAFPTPQIHHSYSSEPYGYPASSSYPPAPPGSPYSNYFPGDIARSGPMQMPSPQQYGFPQVIHVIHHSSHHSHHHHSKHKHKKHSSQSNLRAPMQPLLTPSMSYQSSSSYQSLPVIPPPPQSQHVRFPAASHEVIPPAPAGILRKPQRTRVHSQPTLPTSMPKPAFAPVVEPLNPHSPYSKCTGRKKALCVGINYRGQVNELRGCVNDARNVRKFLIERGKYDPENIILLTDDSKNPRNLPTRDNIIQAMRWLVRHAQPHDALFFHYSGHGGQTPDLDGDEIDGFDEVIYPVDFKSKGFITDDEMHDLMVKPLPPECRLTGLFDACHSGTALDLPYIYSAHGRLRGSQITPQAQLLKASRADVISWSGCKDGQTSADTFSGGVAVGAMSHAFITALTNKPVQTYQELLRSIRLILHPRYSQKPQLGSSHHIDTNLKFVF